MIYSKDKAPFRLGKLKFNQINLLIQAALLIVFITSFVIYNNIIDNASNLLINGVLAILTSLIVEVLFAVTSGKFTDFRTLLLKELPLVIPLTIVLLMPIHASWFIIIIATIISTWIGKLVYGGYGFSIFNPAIVGTLFAQISFKAQLATPEGIEYPIEALKQAGSQLNVVFLNVKDLLFGGYYGISAGSASALLLIILIVLLSIFKAIDWRLSLTYLVTVFGITFIMGNYVYAIEHLLSGTVLFAALFLVTENVTTPTSRETKIVFAVIVGLLTVMIRTLGANTEGVLYAVLLGNLFTPFLNRTVKKSNYISLIKALVFALVVILFAGFALNEILASRLAETLASVTGVMM